MTPPPQAAKAREEPVVTEQPTCNYAACRIFEECANAYDDDEAPPCTKYQSKEHNAAIRKDEREKVMRDELFSVR